MKNAVCFVVVLLFVAVCNASSADTGKSFASSVDNRVQTPEGNHLEDTLIRKLNAKCSQREMSSCLMLKLVTYMNRMLKKAAIQVADDLEITQNGANIEPSNDEELGRSDGSEDDQVTQLLMNKLWTFVKTRSLKWKMFDDAELVVSNVPEPDGSMNIGMSIRGSKDVGEGRGKMKQLAPFLAAAAMKIGLLGGLAFKGLALLVGKALLVSKIALLLASIIGLKKLFSHQKHVTYEVVSHPHHGHEAPSHESFSSGWGRESGRSNEQAQEIAYFGQKPRPETAAAPDVPEVIVPEIPEVAEELVEH